MEIQLVEAGQRSIVPSRLADELRARAEGRIPGAEVHIRAQSGLWMLRRLFTAGGGTDAVEVQLLGHDLDQARTVSTELQRRMSTVVGVVEGGAYREQQESQRDFTIAIILALALVYMVMAAQFERFLDPLVVMFSVPAALIGVIPTLLLSGTTLNVQSIMGMVMLIGIVVNNAIVLVGLCQLEAARDGMSPRDAALVAGRTRLRPILMTTSTTILGLLPLAIGLRGLVILANQPAYCRSATTRSHGGRFPPRAPCSMSLGDDGHQNSHLATK